MIPAHSSGAAAAEIEISGNPQHEVLVDNDALGVATEGARRRAMLVRSAVGQREIGTVLLEPLTAVRARPIRIHHASHAHDVPDLESGDGRADLGDAADNLVPWHARVDGGHHVRPFVPDVVQVRVADPAVENVDLDVARRHATTLDVHRRDWRRRRRGSVGLCAGHASPLLTPHSVLTPHSAAVVPRP